jgi:hypothetical protein
MLVVGTGVSAAGTSLVTEVAVTGLSSMIGVRVAAARAPCRIRLEVPVDWGVAGMDSGTGGRGS